MNLSTLNTYKPLAKFCADHHFIYITVHWDESKEEMQSYYKLTNEDIEEITKEWPTKFLVPVKQIDLPNTEIIGSPLVTRTEYDGPRRTKRKKKKEKVQDIDGEEKENASEETMLDSPRRGGDEVNQEKEGEEYKQEKGEVKPPKDPLTEAYTSNKRKVSPKKCSAWKKSRANKPHNRMCSQWMMLTSSSQW